MNDTLNIAELLRTLEKWREEDKREANQARYRNLSYILWGFALSTTSLVVSNPRAALIVVMIIFWLMGFITLGYSARFRKEKQ